MYQRPTPNPYGDIEPTGNIFTDARRQFVQLFGDAPNSFSAFNPITRAYGEGGFHQHRDRFGQLFEEMQADMAEGMDLNQIREKYSQEPEARAYLNFQANYDPTQFAKDNPDLAERGTMNAKQAWKAALFTDKIDYNEPGGGFYQEQAEKFLSEGDDGRAPATIREYRDRERDDYIGQGGTLRGWMRREPIDPVAVQEREEARRASLTPERRLREDIQSGRVSMEEAREQYPDQFRQAEEMARQDRERLRAEGGIGSLRDRMRNRMGQQGQNRQLIRDQYQDLFGRRPDRAGEDYWMRSLQRGNITPENLRETLIAGADPRDLAYYQQSQDPNLIRPDSAVDFGDEARPYDPIGYGAAEDPRQSDVILPGINKPLGYGAAEDPRQSDVILPGINKPIDYGAADIGGGRPAPRPMSPPLNDQPPLPQIPVEQAPVATMGGTLAYGPDMGGGMMASTNPVTGETTIGAGTFNPNTLPSPYAPIQNLPGFRPSQPQIPTMFGGQAPLPQMGTGPVDPRRALTDPYYRFAPATPPVAASLPPTPASPSVEGNVLSEMPGPVNPMTTPPAAGGFNMPVSDRPFPTDFRPYMAVDDFGAGPVNPMTTPSGGMSPGKGGMSPGKGGMSPGQTYQPYTPAGSGFGGYGGYGGGMSPGQTYQPYRPVNRMPDPYSMGGGYGGGMGGGKGGTQPRPASGGKGGAQYMGTPPSYGQTASGLFGSGVGGMDLYSRAGG